MDDDEFARMMRRKFPGWKSKSTRDTGEIDWSAELRKAETRDQIAPEYSSTSTPMGRLESAGPDGGQLVMLINDRFTYYIGKTDVGEVALFRHGTAEGTLRGVSTGLPTGTKDQLKAFADQKAARETAAMKAIASRVRDFLPTHG